MVVRAAPRDLKELVHAAAVADATEVFPREVLEFLRPPRRVRKAVQLVGREWPEKVREERPRRRHVAVLMRDVDAPDADIETELAGIPFYRRHRLGFALRRIREAVGLAHLAREDIAVFRRPHRAFADTLYLFSRFVPPRVETPFFILLTAEFFPLCRTYHEVEPDLLPLSDGAQELDHLRKRVHLLLGFGRGLLVETVVDIGLDGIRVRFRMRVFAAPHSIRFVSRVDDTRVIRRLGDLDAGILRIEVAFDAAAHRCPRPDIEMNASFERHDLERPPRADPAEPLALVPGAFGRPQVQGREHGFHRERRLA